jgi:hypothetical protein
MNKTLDEYLLEVDRWKKTASEKLASLDESSRLAHYEERREQFDLKLKKQLQVREAKSGETVVKG